MNYETMSDKEVNEKLYKILGLTPSEFDVAAKGAFDHMQSLGGEFALALPDNDSCYGNDYCNRWADIGPLMDEHFISTEYHGHGSNKRVYGYGDNGMVEYFHINPKRAAAICIIKLLSK